MPRKYDMTKPCTHCPFRTDGTAIRFRGRERAAEIEESAYRYGFPCHVTGQQDGDGDSGITFGEDSQHCAGYIIMRIKQSDTAWPGIDNDENLIAALEARIDWGAPVFASDEAYFAANEWPRP